MNHLRASVIGSAITDKTSATYLIEHTTSALFVHESLAAYNAIASIYGDQEDISYQSVKARSGLDDQTLLRFAAAADPDNLPRDISALRGSVFMEAFQKGVARVQKAHEEGKDPGKEYYTMISQMGESAIGSGSGRSYSMADLVRLGVERTMANIDKQIITLGLPIAFKKFNRLSEGLVPGLHFIGGRPGTGKTTLSGAILMDQGRRGNKAGFISLEMKVLRIADKLVSDHLGISDIDLAKGIITNAHIGKYSELASHNFVKNIIFEEFPGSDLASVVSTIYRLRSMGCKLVIIDHIHRMRIDNWRNNTEQMFSTISGSLSSVGISLDIPVVVLGQVSRKVEERLDKRPLLSDIKHSGAIEENCETVTMVYRPSAHSITEDENGIPYEEGYMELVKRKDRLTSKTGIIELIKTKNGIKDLEDVERQVIDDQEFDIPF